MSEIILDEDERDCLQELMNIAYGSATAAITEIVDSFATLSIPKIEIIDSSDLEEHLSIFTKKELSYFVSTQQFNGEMSGENLFIIDKPSSKEIASQYGLEEDEMDDEELSDIVLEITNILSSTTISQLSADMSIEISFSPPAIEMIKNLNDMNNDVLNQYEKVIVISTQLNFEEKNIKGELLILTTDSSILKIKEILNKILEEF
jgi:chemotaxis protein CheC